MITSLLAEHRPLVMGIVNLTPDSFSGDGKIDEAAALKHAKRLIAEGADILDIGGESTRPKSQSVTIQEEFDRVLPFLKLFRKEYPNFPISLDSTKVEIVRVAVADYNIQIINDVSFLANPELAKIAAAHSLWYVLMHARGTPATMEAFTNYPNGIVADVVMEFQAKIKELSQYMPLERLILDPGIGFAKTPAQSAELVNQLEALQTFSRPILLGLSRKRFLTSLGAPERPVEARDALSASLSAQAAMAGHAQILRVHNVALTKKILTDRKHES